MVREALSGASDTRKLLKRVQRLGQVLAVDPGAGSGSRLAPLPAIAGTVAKLAPDRRRLFEVLIGQVVNAYDLVEDSGLAGAIDAAFSGLAAPFRVSDRHDPANPGFQCMGSPSSQALVRDCRVRRVPGHEDGQALARSRNFMQGRRA